MAKVGEGDERWIVEERADGANVNSWHWVERDVLDWAKRCFQELLGNQTLVDGDGGARLRTGNIEVSGEAIINNRKKKLIPSYELEVKGTWSGEVEGGQGAVEGTFKIPYLAEENADEDPELSVAATSNSPDAQKLREAFLGPGKKVVMERVKQFVKEMHAGGPTAAEGPGGPTGAKKGAEVQAAIVAPIREAPKAKAVPLREESPTATVKLTEKFYARPMDIYDCFTNAGRVQAFTHGPAEVEAKVGGKFVILRGAVHATFTALDPGRHIAMDWRFNSYPDDAMSKVDIKLEEPEHGTTVVTLLHKDVPKVDRFGNEGVVDLTNSGWKNQIFNRIRHVFGYGVGL